MKISLRDVRTLIETPMSDPLPTIPVVGDRILLRTGSLVRVAGRLFIPDADEVRLYVEVTSLPTELR